MRFLLLLSDLLPRSFNFLEVHNFFPWGASPAAGPRHLHNCPRKRISSSADRILKCPRRSQRQCERFHMCSCKSAFLNNGAVVESAESEFRCCRHLRLGLLEKTGENFDAFYVHASAVSTAQLFLIFAHKRARWRHMVVTSVSFLPPLNVMS